MRTERAEDIIHRTYVLHGKRAVDSSSGVARRAHANIADALQHTLEDLSEYGYSLVWGKDCARRAWEARIDRRGLA